MEAREIALAAAKALSEKKGNDIVLMNVENKTSLCSYFVIASAGNSTQVKAMSDNVEERLEKNLSLSPSRVDGRNDGRWTVLDYGDVIVHIFLDECRLFYHIERLWEEGSALEKYAD